MKMTIRTIVLVCAGMVMLAGCVEWNAPKTVNVDDGGQENTKYVTKAVAYLQAEDAARQEGQNSKNYTMTDVKTEDAWWIIFDHKINGYKLGWPYHFAVRVTYDGKATIYRNQ